MKPQINSISDYKVIAVPTII